MISRIVLLVILSLGLAAAQDQSASDAGMDHAMHAMSHRHMDMGPHMKLTSAREPRAGDEQRADAVLETARQVARQYADYRDALADGYRIFLPNLPQKQYHFTNWRYAIEAAFLFNPEHPTSLLYEKNGSNWRLIGVMYTAPARADEAELDSRVPLSIARWHEHVNFCAAPKGREREYFGPRPLFGLRGSIVSEDRCRAAGGNFRPQVFGWMVHVYPYEKSADQIWSVERQMEHGH